MRSLLGTSVLAAAPKVIYAFAPPGGWVLSRRVYSPYIDSYYMACTEASIIDALRKVDPHVSVFFNNARYSVEIASHLPDVAFKPALWFSLPIGIVAEHNGVHLPNDYGFKEA